MHIYIYIYNTKLPGGNKGHQEETHHPTHRFRRLSLDLLSMGWRRCASAMGAMKLAPSCSSPKSCVNQFIQYTICSRGDYAVNNSKLCNCVIVTVECFFATIDRCSIMTGMYRRPMMIYSIYWWLPLQRWRPTGVFFNNSPFPTTALWKFWQWNILTKEWRFFSVSFCLA